MGGRLHNLVQPSLEQMMAVLKLIHACEWKTPPSHLAKVGILCHREGKHWPLPFGLYSSHGDTNKHKYACTKE